MHWSLHSQWWLSIVPLLNFQSLPALFHVKESVQPKVKCDKLIKHNSLWTQCRFWKQQIDSVPKERSQTFISQLVFTAIYSSTVWSYYRKWDLSISLWTLAVHDWHSLGTHQICSNPIKEVIRFTGLVTIVNTIINIKMGFGASTWFLFIS